MDELSVEQHCSVMPASLSSPDLATWQDGHHCLCGIRRGTYTFSAELRGPWYQRCCFRKGVLVLFPPMTQTQVQRDQAIPCSGATAQQCRKQCQLCRDVVLFTEVHDQSLDTWTSRSLTPEKHPLYNDMLHPRTHSRSVAASSVIVPSLIACCIACHTIAN